jgi:AcrR family transcriptional regulator
MSNLSEISKDELVRTAILKAAGNCFQKWGLNKTSMEDIAKAASKGKSTLYYYYDSKEQIFDAVVDLETSTALAKFRRAIEDVETAVERIRVYTRLELEELREELLLYKIAIGEMRDIHELFRNVRKKMDEKVIDLISEILTYGIRSGEFALCNERNLRILAETILSMIRGIEMDLAVDRKDSDESFRIEMISNFMANGLKNN